MSYITDNFMLDSPSAQTLYHSYAKECPIIDFHNHLDAKAIAMNTEPRSITELWLGGDHYKWRAMRANGVDEHFITGDASDYEKFEKWAETVPHTMRNPLYHWTHLELKRYFGIDDLLSPKTARDIYDRCNSQIAGGGFGAAELLRKMNVEVVCTTDDPLDTLQYHGTHYGIQVLPTWRPDKLMAIDNIDAFNAYIDRFPKKIEKIADLIPLLDECQENFIAHGCKVSDHGLDTFYAGQTDIYEAEKVFRKARIEDEISENEVCTYKAAMLHLLGKMNNKAGWVQQFHIGPLRNNSSRLFRQLGPDIGCDSMGDKPLAESMSRFLDQLDSTGELTKTIVYNLNPRDTELIATMLYNFNDGTSPGKMQYGAAWWFLDQADGMRRQVDALSSLGLLSHFVGMLTDSRSFMSFTRHEYFRRLLCNIIGGEIENGLLPSSEMENIGQMVQRICYTNAKNYFGL